MRLLLIIITTMNSFLNWIELNWIWMSVKDEDEKKKLFKKRIAEDTPFFNVSSVWYLSIKLREKCRV